MVPTRVGLAMMIFLAFFNLYTTRVNISFAIVCMVNHTAVKLSHVTSQNNTDQYENDINCTNDFTFGPKSSFGEGTFTWPKETQGLMLSSFFWGYIVTQVPGGILSMRFGGKRVLGVALSIAAVLTILTPVIARVSPIFLIALRIILGLAEGCVFPAAGSLWASWAPPNERSKLTAGSYAGMQVGTVVILASSGVVCDYLGWAAIFYISGSFCIASCLLWFFVVYDSPEEHPRISADERKYIQTALRSQMTVNKSQTARAPWKSILKSKPVWGIVLADFTIGWIFYTFLTNIPSYVNDVLQINIKSNGLFTALTYSMMWLFLILTGIISDCIRVRNILSTTAVRKVAFSFGMITPSAAIIGLTFLDCSTPILTLLILTVGVASLGCSQCVSMVNQADLAPRFTGVVLGLSNTSASLAGLLAPAIIGYMTKHQTRDEWKSVFYVCAGIGCVGAIIFLILGSGEVQDWAVVNVVEDGDNYDLDTKRLTNDETA